MGPSCAQVVHCHNVCRVHDKTQNLLLFSLKYHPIYPGIHKDPSIGVNLNEPAIIEVRSLKSLGKGSFWGRGQILLQIIRLNTLVDVIRVPQVRTSGE